MSAPLGRRRRLFVLAAAGLVLLSAGCAASRGGARAPAGGGGPAGWHLIWSSDFAGSSGTSPSGWTFENSGDGEGNHEQEYYVSAAQNASTRNAVLDGHGDLAITARRNSDPGLRCSFDAAGDYAPAGLPCRYISARLDSSALIIQRYGRMEARIEVPAGQGLWPAFWAVGTDIGAVGWPASGEIDTMEILGGRPDVLRAHLHGPIAGTFPPQPYAVSAGQGAGYQLPGDQSFSAGFHTYAADWYPDHISFSVDGHIYATIYKAAMPAGDTWVFGKPFYLILNLAVGSAQSWPGAPTSSTVFPATLLVNYVRVYSAGTTPAPAGQVTDAAGGCLDSTDQHVAVASCGAAAPQVWTFGSDGTVRRAGQCLATAAAGAAKQAVLTSCDGDAGEQWRLETDGSLVNVATGLCLSAGPPGPASSAAGLAACAGAAGQLWTRRAQPQRASQSGSGQPGLGS
jgi:hypothetical protein